jgi:hypothetical protein
MEWRCGCGNEATRIEVLCQWRDAAAIGQKQGRNVSYRCRIGCDGCVPNEEDERGRLQYFEVKLSVGTKQALVSQVVAQIFKMHPRGYLPKSDIQQALKSVSKAL